jgi:hypothetical protein
MKNLNGGTSDLETGQVTEATSYGSPGHGAVKSAARVLITESECGTILQARLAVAGRLMASHL